MIFVIGFAFYKILYIREKNQIKQCLKIAMNRLLGAFIPILIFAIYLTIFNLWADFIDYALVGITTFSNMIPYHLLFLNGNYGIRILAGIYLFQMALMITIYLASLIDKKIQKKEWYNEFFILLMYTCIISIVMIPIADKMHFGIGSICTIITFIIYIYNCLIKRLGSKYITIISQIIFFIGICYSLTILIAVFQNGNIRTDIKHFKYSRIEKDIYERVVEVSNYIKEQETKGKEVHELDMLSATYSISLDKYYKDYDMFNLGNFGSKGTKGIIEDLSQKENLIILLKKEKYKKNWQYPEEVAEYIRKNFNRIGEINIYDIYEK